MGNSHRRPRRAFTLMELVVVTAIIILIASAGYFALPKNMAGDYTRVRGIDQLSQWLLTAKQRAKRDSSGSGIGLPTGIRLVDATTNLPAGNLSTPNGFTPNGVMYVQQPDTLYGTETGGSCNATAGGASTTIIFTLPAGIDFLGGAAVGGQADQALVQPGDYLQVNGGPVHQVVAPITSTSVTLNSALNVPVPTQNYKFYRQPRPISGEDTKQLPGDLVIDLTTSLNVPSRTVSGTTFVEIVFSQSGSVIGFGTAGGKIALMVRDNNPTNPTIVTLAPIVNVTGPPPTLITIQSRSGFIGAFDVAVGGTDLYLYTENGQSGGL